MVREVRLYNYPGDTDFRFENVSMCQTLRKYVNHQGLETYVFEYTHVTPYYTSYQLHSYAYEHGHLDTDNNMLVCCMYPSKEEYLKHKDANDAKEKYMKDNHPTMTH